tara:strand:- start:446 stop:1483 length:1038 start_codon:yes stop_codon:yes gene_type:complete
MDFQPIVELAGVLNNKPELVPLIADSRPVAYENAVRVLQTPFFRFQPFGLWEGVHYGGYENVKDQGYEPQNACQVGFLKDQSINKWATAGNRGGKSLLGAIEDTADALWIDPITKTFRKDGDRFSGDPLRIWVVSDTEETSVMDTERIYYDQVLGADESGVMWNMIDDSCSFTEKNGWSGHLLKFTNGSSIQFKFSTQKRKTFQGVRLHKVRLNEVQPKPIYSECTARLADFNGYLVGTMTPLDDKGVPWIYEDLYIQRKQRNIAFHQWSMFDNPHIPRVSKDRLIEMWDEDEIEARAYGAFVPIGQKLAFSHSLIRDMRQTITAPQTGLLSMNDQGFRFDVKTA